MFYGQTSPNLTFLLEIKDAMSSVRLQQLVDIIDNVNNKKIKKIFLLSSSGLISIVSHSQNIQTDG